MNETMEETDDVIKRHVLIHSQIIQTIPEPVETSIDSIDSILASPNSFFVPLIESPNSFSTDPIQPVDEFIISEATHTSDYGTQNRPLSRHPSAVMQQSCSGYGSMEKSKSTQMSKYALGFRSKTNSQGSDMDIDMELTQRQGVSEYREVTEAEVIPVSVTIPETPENSIDVEMLTPKTPTRRTTYQSSDLFATTDDERLSESYENFENSLLPNIVMSSSAGSNLGKHSTPIRSRYTDKSSARFLCYQPEMVLQTAPEPYHPLAYHLDVEAQSCPAKVFRDPLKQRTEALIAQIEGLFRSFIHSLMSEGDMVIRVRKQNEWTNTEYEDEAVTLKSTQEADFKDINFRNKNSERKFAIVVRLLSEVHKLLATGVSCTPREIFYRDQELFESQTDVNQAIRETCCLLQATPWELRIMSTSKGLVAGDLKIVMSNDDVVDCAIEDGVLLPYSIAGLRRLDTTARFVLLVEKDTVFKKLLDSFIFDKQGYDIILVTGKGYPDLNTRLLLKKLYEQHKLPIYALTDADPHGIEIMFTYRFGSLAQSHNSEHLAIPSIRWMGVHPSDIENFQLPTLQLTTEDELKLKALFKRPYMNANFYRELQLMLTTKLKAEIEGVSAIGMNYLVDEYIPKKMNDNIVI